MEPHNQSVGSEPRNSSPFQQAPLPRSEGRHFLTYYNEELPELVDAAPQSKRYLTERLAGKRLIDVGTGDLANMVAQFAVRTQVAELISVEKHHWPKIIHDPRALTQYINGYAYDRLSGEIESRCKLFITRTEAEIVALSTGLETLQFSPVRSGMLEYLKDQPDGSANILMGGIDQFILDPGPYREAVVREIGRVLGREGVLLDRHSVQPSDGEALAEAGLRPDPEYMRCIEADGLLKDWTSHPFTDVYVSRTNSVTGE